MMGDEAQKKRYHWIGSWSLPLLLETQVHHSTKRSQKSDGDLQDGDLMVVQGCTWMFQARWINLGADYDLASFKMGKV